MQFGLEPITLTQSTKYFLLSLDMGKCVISLYFLMQIIAGDTLKCRNAFEKIKQG